MEFALAAYWLLAVLGFAAGVTPVCLRLFPGFPDRGASLAPGVAFALLAVVAYWLGHVTYGDWVAAASVILVLALGAVAARNATLPDRRAITPPLVVFVAAFAFFVAVRAVDPAVHAAGGEKFLDYSLMRTIVLADRLPPEDVWFAGRPLRYYYGGILSYTAFAQALGVHTKYAYNLGIATSYAALAAGAYGLAAAVADHRGRSPALAGVLAVALVCLGGYPATPVRVLAGFLPAEFVHEYGRFLVSGIRMATGDAFHVATTLAPWNYWIARYVVPSTITVTPFWAYLNGDFHAHVIAPAFLLSAAAVAFAGWRATDDRRRALLLLGALPVFAGALAVTSTWSFPTAAGLAFLAFALADPHPGSVLPARIRGPIPDAGPLREVSRYALAGVAGVAVGLAGAAFAAPFFLFHAPANSGIGFLPPRSPLAPYVLVWGGFIAAFTAHLARDARLTARQTTAAFAAWAVLLAAGLAHDAASLLLLAPFLAAAWYLRRTNRVGFTAVLAVAGAGMLLAVELAYARVWPFDPNAVRWNTVYKVSMQVSVLWGVGAGVAAAGLLQPVLDRARAAVDATRSGAADATTTLSRVDAAGAAVALLVVSASLTFPALALSDHFGDPVREPREATLDATQFVEIYHPHEADAFEWLRAHVDGQPAMLTAVGEPMYTWVSAPAVFTGIPTVLGWRHEKGYRGPREYRERKADVRFMYVADQPTQALLFDKYDVQYVYYGPVERERYPDATFTGPGVSVAYRNARVVIYRVNPEAACAATNFTCYPD